MLTRPVIPEYCGHNGHMYYVILAPGVDRQKLLDKFRSEEIWAIFHYVPLHDSPAGRRYGRTSGNLAVTEDQAERLVRLPLWYGLTEKQQDRVVELLGEFLL